MKLIKIEFLKLSQNVGIWIMLGIYFLLLLILMASLQSIAEGMVMNGQEGTLPSIYEFPGVWQNMGWIASNVIVIPAIAIVTLVAAEFTNKTLRAQLINGMTRTEFFLGKLYFILILAAFSTLLLLIAGMIMGFVYTPEKPTSSIIFERIPFLLGYFLQLVGYMLFAFMLTFLVKKPGITIGLLLIYTFVDYVAGWIGGVEFARFLPVSSFLELVQRPFRLMPRAGMNDFRWLQLIPTLLYCGVFSGAILLMLNKRDQ